MAIDFGIVEQYGPLRDSMTITIAGDYSVLVGENDAGKSSILQRIVVKLFHSSRVSNDSFCLIEADRQYVQPKAPTQTSLSAYNESLVRNNSGGPRRLEGVPNHNPSILYATLLESGDFVANLQGINALLVRMGFPAIVLQEQQTVRLNTVDLVSHGSGLRAVLPILAGLVSPMVKILMIDEPELSLEPKKARVLADILKEKADSEKQIIIATQSHLFLNRDSVADNYRVAMNGSGTSLQPLSTEEEMVEIVYDMLGNSLGDIFMPDNFLIVEGSSDDYIARKVRDLLGASSINLKVFSAQGVDNAEPSFKVIERMFKVIGASHSPYAGRIVFLFDQITDPLKKKVVDKIEAKVGAVRCIQLDQPNIEEYLPDALYVKAGLVKSARIAEIHQKTQEFKGASADRATKLKELSDLKRDTSTKIGDILELGDLDSIPKITEAVQKALEH